MLRRLPVLLCALLLGGSAVGAQPSDPLDRFAGDWDLHGEAAGQSYHVLEYCRWSNQHAFMICEERVAEKPTANATLMWQDAKAKVFRYSSIGIHGSTGTGTIAITPSRWTWNETDGHVLYKTVNDWVSSSEIQYASSESHDGGKTWKPNGKGTERRVAR